MELYILRHGKAQEHTQNFAGDSKRELTEVGKKELCCIAKAIKNLEIDVDDIISSPLIRAKQTAEIIIKHVKSKKKSIKIWNELKPDSSIMLVGHEPHLTDLISKIISNDGTVDISLKKGGLVHIICNIAKGKISGSLRSIMTPKQLKKLCR